MPPSIITLEPTKERPDYEMTCTPEGSVLMLSSRWGSISPTQGLGDRLMHFQYLGLGAGAACPGVE